MNQTTTSAISQLNQQFYQETAEKFSQTRQTPWQGWHILTTDYLPKHAKLSVLDIGCGNGRFGKFLHEQDLLDNYLGVDFSSQLLKEVETELADHKKTRFLNQDIASIDLLQKDLLGEAFDLVVMFGLMHHLPGSENRLKLVREVMRLAKGILVVSFWQFANFDRFQQKIISWDTMPEIDQSELEAGDYLLDFNGTPPYRYCHSFSDRELAGIKTDFKDHLLGEFQADGKEKYNRYLVLSAKNTDKHWTKNQSSQ